MPLLLSAMFCLEGDDTHATITLCIFQLQDADNADQAATDLSELSVVIIRLGGWHFGDCH